MIDKFKSFISSNKVSSPLGNIRNLQDLKNLVATKSIFSVLENQDQSNKLKFVGGCVRKLLNKEKVNDIDIATSLTPSELKNILIEKKVFFDIFFT